VIDCLTPRD